MQRRLVFIALGWVVALGVGMLVYVLWPEEGWSTEQITALRGLWLGSLEPLAPDPSNAVADDPRATTLGHKLFFDSRFSANGAVSCASCHARAATCLARTSTTACHLGEGLEQRIARR